MSSQGHEATMPLGSTNGEDDASITKYDYGTFSLIGKLLRQEQQSKHYQGRLEAILYGESAAHQKLRGYCIQLQRVVSELQNQKSQLEASVRHATDCCHAISRDLGLERNKVQELESRLNELYPAINTLLLRLSPGGPNTGCIDEECIKTCCQLFQENQYQQEWISRLQSTLHSRERTVQELTALLGQQVKQGNPPTMALGLQADHNNAERSVSSSGSSSVDIITENPSSFKAED